MINKQFIQSENIQMLWDIISDEEIFKFLNKSVQNSIYDIFLKNFQGFYENEKQNVLLVDLNKKYILLILNYIKKTYPYQPSKIKIHNENTFKDLITYEEIHNDRQTQFEKDLSKKQEEFEDSITLKKPPLPEFADKERDKPIQEIDKILKEMIVTRNYEVEQINRTFNTSNQVDNWLKPQETSLKNEKFGETNLKPEKIADNKFKYLNSFQKNFVPTKSVSFSSENEIRIFDDSINDNNNDNDNDDIFSKLKKVNVNESIQDNDNDKNDNDNNDIFSKLKKVNVNSINENRISNLEKNMKLLNEKVDQIIDLLRSKNDS
jgi:hypothetical protein